MSIAVRPPRGRAGLYVFIHVLDPSPLVMALCDLRHFPHPSELCFLIGEAYEEVRVSPLHLYKPLS